MHPDDFGDYLTVDLVWADPKTGAVIFVGAEGAITPEWLRENKIDLVVTVNEGFQGIRGVMEDEEAQEVCWCIHPFLDAPGKEQTEGHAKEAAEAVKCLVDAFKDGVRVVVHCRAGINRSTAVVYVALVESGRVPTLYEAHRMVKRNRSVAGFHKSLVKWVRKQYQAKYPKGEPS